MSVAGRVPHTDLGRGSGRSVVHIATEHRSLVLVMHRAETRGGTESWRDSVEDRENVSVISAILIPFEYWTFSTDRKTESGSCGLSQWNLDERRNVQERSEPETTGQLEVETDQQTKTPTLKVTATVTVPPGSGFSPTLFIPSMDAHAYPGMGLSLSQLAFALGEELKRAAHSPSYVQKLLEK